MHASVEITVTRDGESLGRSCLGHGAIIGRLATAALQLDDIRVSEAHALVSLRDGGLQLLALRRRFSVDGRPMSSLALSPGVKVALADGLELHVTALQLPERVVGLAWSGETGVPLLHDAASLAVAEEGLVLSWRVDPTAPLRLWRVGDDWRASLTAGEAFDIELGAVIDVRGHRVEVVAVPLHEVQAAETRGVDDALHVVLFYDTVHIHRRGCPVVVVAGHGARLMSELGATGAPLSWKAAAQLLWSEPAEDNLLRNRLDAVLRRLRQKLAAEGVRDDLVSLDGIGHVELRLGASDRLDDRS